MLQNPDVRAPVRKELHYWAPVQTPEKNCADHPSCEIFKFAAAAAAKAGSSTAKATGTPRWPLGKSVVGRMLTAYLELFPRVDPRDFALTGEASPAYIYSPSVALFLESSLMGHTKLLISLRDPTERAFSEYKNKRDLMVKGAPKASAWVNGHAQFDRFVAGLRAATDGCTPEALYAACEPCARFVAAPGASVPAAARNASDGRCKVAPVIWQSWYHLFIPRYLRHGQRVLIEFSDDMFDDASATMQRVVIAAMAARCHWLWRTESSSPSSWRGKNALLKSAS